ncbi:type IV pilus modification protein PilV [Marinihelvus fidelis]|nr:type IV pilus modification protein PilV [Marinihelvus fidelis]
MNRKQDGMTLIEVLIALAVLSIGMVGMAAMHMQTLKYVHSAHYRSVASTVALDLEERLWLNLATRDSGCPDTSGGTDAPVGQLRTHWNRSSVGGEDWNWSTADMVKIPNLTVTTGFILPSASVVNVPVTFTWSENRFSAGGEGEESTTESFTYNLRVMCRPT